MIDKIKCPNCSNEFDVEQALAGPLEAQFQAKFAQKESQRLQEYKLKKEAFEKEQEEFEKKKERENEIFKERLAQKMVQETEKVQKEAQAAFELQLKNAALENQKKTEEIRKFKTAELDLLLREKELKEKAEDLELNLQKQMLEKQQEIEEKAKIKEREANMLREKELQKQLEDQKKLIDEMKRKAEQGSMQMQGEIQELALEALLKNTYPFDIISEVPKGVRGADSIQTVINDRQQKCGSIVYESKRTKNFANDWIDKLKQDQISCKADIAVIVTETYPTDMDKFGVKDGVYICGFHEVKSLSFILRQILLQTQSVKSAEDNKGEKMELLYSYLTSNEFVQNIKRIVENYDNMVSELNSEKKAMHRIWATREKSIWVVQENISTLFGSIKGIAGNELATSSVLELPDRTIGDL